MSSDWRPIKVLVLDAEHMPDPIVVDPRYQAAWALIRQNGRPRGMVKVPVEAGAVSPRQLAEAIAQLPSPVTAPAPAVPPDRMPPRVTVVVCTLFGRLDDLHECLASLQAMDYPDYEVVVVDNRPAGAEPVELDGVRVVREPKPGLAAARNRGVDEARGEVVAFTDDDVIVEPDWVTAIVARLLAHPEEAGVMGLAIPRELETPAQVALENFYGGFGPRTFQAVSHRLRVDWNQQRVFTLPLVEARADDGRLVSTFSLYAAGTFGPGANMAFRAQILRDAGGFDTYLGPGTPTQGGEELYLYMRLAQRGYALGFEPASVVRHRHRQDAEGLRKQIKAYGVGWTALLTAAVVDDPRHLARMLATVPRAIRVFTVKLARRLRTPAGTRTGAEDSGAVALEDELLAGLAQLQLRGNLLGPICYLRSRIRTWP